MFVNWAEQQLEDDPDFHQKIIFSDEAPFWLNGFVNKQNMSYWSGSNPHVLHESSLHPEKITVITEYFWPDMDDMDLVVPTGRRLKSHSECHNRIIESQVW